MDKNKNKYSKTLCTIGSNNELEKIRNFIQYWANDFGFNNIDTNKIILAVDEVCSNLIKYSFSKDTNSEICIKIETKKPDFIINIADDSAPFDLTERPDLNINEYFSKISRGGLGIYIIKSVMDEITYKPSDGSQNKNILRLKKQLL